MAHYCICPKCGERFNRDIIQAVRVGPRRYGHATCYPDNKDFVPMGEPVDKDLIALKDYIKEIYKDKANWVLINKQIKKFHTDNKFSYSGMLKSLVYFYEVKGNSADKSNGGIGIIEYTYEDAYKYYLNLFLANQVNEDKDIKEYTSKTREITITPPVANITKHYFKFLEDDIDEQE